MSIKEQIKAEIERLYNNKAYSEDRWDLGYDCACEDIMSFLDTLEEKSEKPNNPVDLEKEIKEYCGTRDICPVPDFIDAVARHFYELGRNAK